MVRLQQMLEAVPLEALSPSWTTFDLAAFSDSKRLFEYQQEALQYALKALWKYYDHLQDWRAGEPDEADGERKKRLLEWYRDNGLDEELDINLSRASREIASLLAHYYPVHNGRINYEHFINRMSFWMATGSGKTLVLVKLIELLGQLIRRREIPPHDILVLTHRDDLVVQLQRHVHEYNASRHGYMIRLRDLREYPDAKRESASLFSDQELTVFYYRSDNVSDEQKEKIVDFRNYDNYGRWYILLDEAHKGDREESKRQHIYSILSRRGFLFNFSATFTDPRDVVTTAYDFNLARFIGAGYGKHICVLKQETRAFRDGEDYTGEEKQRLVLKALLILAYVDKSRARILEKGGALYHRPLLLTLVHSVNTQDADLKLFFRQLARIGKGEVTDEVFRQAKAELWSELAEGLDWLFENQRLTLDPSLFDALSYADLLLTVFNAHSPADIEVLVRPSNRQEMAFKLKSAERPFALARIGDISGWLKEELVGYEVVESFRDEGFFEHLNADDADITVLMGSRAFYEGWDSNRPNVIAFINIGTGTDARKFILQAVGRGVRIEPLAGKRRRLQALYNAGEISGTLFRLVRGDAPALETLFVFGTNRNALQTVIEELNLEAGAQQGHEITLALNAKAIGQQTLLVPVYRQAQRPLSEYDQRHKFPILSEEMNLLQAYVRYIGDDRVLLARHDATAHQLKLLRKALAAPEAYFQTSEARRYGDVHLLLTRLFDYFNLVPEELDRLKPLDEEIRHFRHIKVLLQDIRELRTKIEQVQRYVEPATAERELKEKFESGTIDLDTLMRRLQEIARLTPEDTFTAEGHELRIKYVANHYYIPVLLSESERIHYIRHVIRHESEARFIRHLEEYVRQPGHAFGRFDWWLFSKLDEALDEVYIPYYDPAANRIRRFYPDFVFWLQKGQDFFIAFVDPKGTVHENYSAKLSGYRALFTDGVSPKVFVYGGLRVRVFLFFYNPDARRIREDDRPYWYDTPSQIAECLYRVSVG